MNKTLQLVSDREKKEKKKKMGRGRGRVVLERIENKINRQVSFSKRRNGLLKKAYELSVLCDARVALVIFSSRGKLFQFGTTDMNIILEQYRQFSYTSRENNVVENDSQNLSQEIARLKVQNESLQQSERHLLGEDLEGLSLKELQNIEKQLDKTLSQTRQRKFQLLVERLEELHKKERDLEEMNKKLKSKLEEGRHALSAAESEPDLEIGVSYANGLQMKRINGSKE